MSRERRLELGLVYCSLVWGATFPLVKDVVGSMPPAALVGWRFTLSALCLLPWVLRRPRPSAQLKEGLVLGAILLALYLSQTAGLVYTSAANSGFITGLFVLFTPLFLWLFRRKAPSGAQWAASGLAAGGLWLLTGGASGFNRGDALTLVAAMTYAAHLLATDAYTRRDSDPVLLAFHQFWVCAAGSFLVAFVTGAPTRVPSARAWGAVWFLALIPNLSAFFIQLVAQKTVAPMRVSLIFSLEPVFAALFAWTVGGEPCTALSAVGGALIVAAMMADTVAEHPALKGRLREVLPV
ncbi:hypothetical protein EPO15_18155 [bacterium]|nr:MAG: hypothetical protein EPO15_18155 [bacterium]